MASNDAAPAFAAADGHPLAGRLGEYFYLRDAHDEFRLYIGGRVHVDAFVPFGAGVTEGSAGTGLEPTFFIRRARPELAGEFLGHWQWMVSGDWGRTAVTDGNGQTGATSCSVNAKTSALTCAVRSAQVEAPSYTAQPTDVYINFHAADVFNVEAGQFKMPFTLENRTSENYTPVPRDLSSRADHRRTLEPRHRGDGLGRDEREPLSLRGWPLQRRRAERHERRVQLRRASGASSPTRSQGRRAP